MRACIYVLELPLGLDPDRDARHTDITYAAWRVERSRREVSRTAVDSGCEVATVSAGLVAALTLQTAQKQDRPMWWSGIRCAPPGSSERNVTLDASDSRGYCKVRRNRNRVQWHILYNAVPCRYTCNTATNHAWAKRKVISTAKYTIFSRIYLELLREQWNIVSFIAKAPDRNQCLRFDYNGQLLWIYTYTMERAYWPVLDRRTRKVPSGRPFRMWSASGREPCK